MPNDSEKKKRCFVIGPIGDEASATRRRSDQLLKYVIEPIAEEHGYQVDRADKIAEPGIITNQIIQNIVDADLVVADLTEKNPNVFYELAIRHGLQKPFIHIIEASEKIPFDIAGVRAIQIKINDLDSVDNAKSEISQQIKSINEGKMPIDNPISVSFDMQKLRQSSKTSDRIQADIVQSQTDMQASIRRIERNILYIFELSRARINKELIYNAENIKKDHLMPLHSRTEALENVIERTRRIIENTSSHDSARRAGGT